MRQSIDAIEIPGAGMCISTAEMARRLQLSRQAVHEALRRGAIHAYRVGQVNFIPIADVEKYKNVSLRRPGKKAKKD